MRRQMIQALDGVDVLHSDRPQRRAEAWGDLGRDRWATGAHAASSPPFHAPF